MLTELIMAIISQYIQISNHYVIHLGLIQCYVNYISITGGIEDAKNNAYTAYPAAEGCL